jgi:Na+/H+ antiporter NhaA
MIQLLLTWALTTGALYLLQYLTPTQVSGDNLWLSAIIIVVVSFAISFAASALIGVVTFSITRRMNSYNFSGILILGLIVWFLCLSIGVLTTIAGVSMATTISGLYIDPKIYWAVVLVVGVAIGLGSKSAHNKEGRKKS